MAPPKSLLVSAISCANECLSSSARTIKSFLESLAKSRNLPKPEDVQSNQNYFKNINFCNFTHDFCSKGRVAKVRGFVESAAKKIRAAVEATKPLKNKFPFLKKNARMLRDKIVDKLQSCYDRTKDDLNDFFPYPEVKDFLEHFNDYFEVALLEPEKISEANKTEILGELEKALEKIFANSYSFDFAKGHISAKVSRTLLQNFARTFLVKKFSCSCHS